MPLRLLSTNHESPGFSRGERQMEMLKRDVARAEKEKYQEQQRYWALMKEVQSLYGYHWRHPNSKKTDEEES